MISRRTIMILAAAATCRPVIAFSQDMNMGNNFTIGGPATLDVIPDGVFSFNADREQWPEIMLNLEDQQLSLEDYVSELEGAGLPPWNDPTMPLVITRNPELFPNITQEELEGVRGLGELDFYEYEKDGFRYIYGCYLVSYVCECVSS